jgi:heme o synthase
MNTCNGCKKNNLLEKLPAASTGLFPGGRWPWLQLIKLPVCLLIAFSALFGSTLSEPINTSQSLLTALGILLLACGCATLNSLQEIRLDSSMKRTKNRPLPMGHIPVVHAWILSATLITGGLALLYVASSMLAVVAMGLVAVILYNGVYTPLKTKTVAAIIPGALSGALPPYIGWTAAGGDPLSMTALLLYALFILWQVPHSLLIVLKHQDDYLENVIPSLIKILPESSLRRIFLIWIGAFSVVFLFLTGAPPVCVDGMRVVLQISIVLVLLVICAQLLNGRKADYHFLFIQLNLYLFISMAILTGKRMFFS